MSDNAHAPLNAKANVRGNVNRQSNDSLYDDDDDYDEYPSPSKAAYNPKVGPRSRSKSSLV